MIIRARDTRVHVVNRLDPTADHEDDGDRCKRHKGLDEDMELFSSMEAGQGKSPNPYCLK